MVAKDPFLTRHPGTQPLSEEYIDLDGHNIRVKPYILPYLNKLSPSDIELLGTLDDLRNKQGIYVYRNNRLIIWGTWFRLDTKNELNKLARIRVDIPNSLDHIWDIDIKKSTASLPNSIKQNLKFIVKRAIGSSERVYTHQGNKLINDEHVHVWELRKTKEETFFEINKELLIYKAFLESLSTEQAKQFKALIKLMEATVPFKAAYILLAKNEERSWEELLEKFGMSAHQQGLNLPAVKGVESRRKNKKLTTADSFGSYQKALSNTIWDDEQWEALESTPITISNIL